MSGKTQFDQHNVLSAAISVFRAHGFAGASLSALEQATGLNKSSIYNSYRSKEGLYSAAMDYFRTAYTNQAMKILDEADFFNGLEKLFSIFGNFDSPNFPGGCMATLGALEMGGNNDEVSRIIASALDEMLEKFEQRCQLAVEDGQLANDTDCSALAAMIVAVCRGVIVLNKGTGKPDAGRQAYAMLLQLLK